MFTRTFIRLTFLAAMAAAVLSVEFVRLSGTSSHQLMVAFASVQ